MENKTEPIINIVSSLTIKPQNIAKFRLLATTGKIRASSMVKYLV